MWMIDTIETPDKIVVTGRGEFLVFCALLFPTVVILNAAINSPNWVNIIISLIFVFFSFIYSGEPSKTVSEFNINERKLQVKSKHPIFRYAVKEISFEEIESIEVITHRTLRSSMASYSLTLNVKDQLFGIGTNLGYIPRAAELQEKLNQIIGLPK